MVGTTLAAYSATPALRHTISRAGPVSPASTPSSMSARLLGRFHLERAVAGHLQAEVLRVDFVLGDLAVLELTHQRGGAQAHFVHAVAAIDHHGMLGAQALQRAHLDAHQVGDGTRP